MRLRFCPVPQVDEVDAESECRATGGGGCDRQDRLRPRTTRSREPPVSCEQTEHRPTTPARSSRTTPPIGTSMPSSPRRRNTPPPLHQASRVVPASCSPGPGARRQLHVQPWAADGSRRHASFGRLRRADGVAEVEGCVPGRRSERARKAPRAIAAEGEELVVPRLHPWAHGRSPGPTVSPYAARRRFAGGSSVDSGREGQRGYPLPSTSNLHRTGGLRQAPGRAA
jgi:hypothetical protein